MFSFFKTPSCHKSIFNITLACSESTICVCTVLVPPWKQHRLISCKTAEKGGPNRIQVPHKAQVSVLFHHIFTFYTLMETKLDCNKKGTRTRDDRFRGETLTSTQLYLRSHTCKMRGVPVIPLQTDGGKKPLLSLSQYTSITLAFCIFCSSEAFSSALKRPTWKESVQKSDTSGSPEVFPHKGAKKSSTWRESAEELPNICSNVANIWRPPVRMIKSQSWSNTMHSSAHSRNPCKAVYHWQ